MTESSRKLIYIDVCALCRPFDDQSLLRIKLETDAVNLILLKVKEGLYRMAVSPVHLKEIESIKDEVERIHLTILLNKYGWSQLDINIKKVRNRAERLVSLGFGIADAAHAAFAEELNAEFISCDKKLIKKCSAYIKAIRCVNPLNFCEMEALQ